MARKDYQTPEEKAWKVVEDKQKFKKHLTAFIGVGMMMFSINLVTDPGNWWFQWTLYGWGIGIIWHFVAVYVPEFLKSDDENWAQSEYEKQLRRFKPDRENHWDDDDALDLEDHPLKATRSSYRDSDLV